jgi:hypothetical protein
MPVALHVSHAVLTNISFKFFTKTQPSQRDKNFNMITPPPSKRLTSPLCCVFLQPIATLSYFLPNALIFSILPLAEGRAGTAWKHSEQ